jgi:hypothetical protein
MHYPLLKYAVRTETDQNAVCLTYRNKLYRQVTSDAVRLSRALEMCNGRTRIANIVSSAGIEEAELTRVLSDLEKIPLILDGQNVLREDGYLSGREMFWRLEDLMFVWRSDEGKGLYGPTLDGRIALGIEPLSVVKGFLIELGFLLRQVPEELALAVANSTNEDIRLLFMEFYDEESRHGQMMFDALKQWIPECGILSAIPLPATVGLMNTYKAAAMKHPLLYATALIRDESSALDAEIPPEADIYVGMKEHYDIPKDVIKVFEWHANLDRTCDHGFFPEEVFALYPIVTRELANQLCGFLHTMIEMHQLFKWNISVYYHDHVPELRMLTYDKMQKGAICSYA